MPEKPPLLRSERPLLAVQDHMESGGPPQAGLSADEREFDAFAQAQDPLDIAAATWVTRKRSGLSADDEAGLRAWLDVDPRHARAFAEMEAFFGDLQQLPDDDVTRLRVGLPTHDAAAQVAPYCAQSSSVRVPRPTRSSAGRGSAIARLWSLLCPLLPQAASAVVVFFMLWGGWTGWSQWQSRPVFEQTYATERGQQLRITLPDAAADASVGVSGSTLQMDTATHARVRLYRDRREVHLLSGQAMFAVYSDSQRPFHVYAGGLRITVVGTRFSVRSTGSGLNAGQTVVAVEEGRVRVGNGRPGPEGMAEGGYAAAGVLELAAGQAVAADAQGRIGEVVTLAASSIAPWREGRLSFQQIPLAEAIAEFERYGQTGLVVRDPAVAALPVGGSYSLKQWQRFVETLPQVLPVRLVRRGDVTEVVAR